MRKCIGAGLLFCRKILIFADWRAPRGSKGLPFRHIANIKPPYTMNFKVEGKTFQQQLQAVSKVINSKNTI